MADLLNNQWELDGVVFGQDAEIDTEAEVTPSTYGLRTQDSPSPVGDATMFGRDLIEPDVWGFKLFTNVEDEQNALRLRSTLAKVWRADDVRKTPGAVKVLRYRMAGRTRRVYGRPRRFDAPLDNRMFSGLIAITCDFKLASELFFDDVEQNIPVRASQSTSSGGFLVPFTVPLTLSSSLTPRATTFTVGGELPTPGIFDFKGPSTDAALEIDGAMRVQLTGTVPVGVTVTVDARPWVMSIYRDDGAGTAGLLNRRTRLPRLLLEPGAHEVTYSAYDPTGASGGAVRWHDAYPSV